MISGKRLLTAFRIAGDVTESSRRGHIDLSSVAHSAAETKRIKHFAIIFGHD